MAPPDNILHDGRSREALQILVCRSVGVLDRNAVSSMTVMQSSSLIVQIRGGHLELANVVRHLSGMAINQVPALQVQTSLAFEECCTHNTQDTCVQQFARSDVDLKHTSQLGIRLKDS